MQDKPLNAKPSLAGRGSPHPNQMILGKRRGQWVRDAARALIGSTTPSGRFLLMREGFDVFFERAKPALRAFVDFDLTAGELRWVYDYIARYIVETGKVRHRLPNGAVIRMREIDIQPELERRYQRQLRKNLTPDSLEEDTSGPLDITTESTRGDRQVHIDGKRIA